MIRGHIAVAVILALHIDTVEKLIHGIPAFRANCLSQRVCAGLQLHGIRFPAEFTRYAGGRRQVER